MVEIADINDKSSLEAWLNGQPREVAVQIAYRSAMRVAPIYWQWQSRKGDLSDISIWRSLLICGVAGNLPTPQIMDAAKAAGFAANAAATTADNAADATSASVAATAAANAAGNATVAAVVGATNTADATYSVVNQAIAAAANAANAPIGITENPAIAINAAAVTAANDATWEVARRDAAKLAGSDPPLEVALWPGAPSPVIGAAWANARARLAAAPGYAWWINWYDALMQGTPPNWPLLSRIALIDDAVWKAGPEAVAEKIAEIEEQHRLLGEVRDLRKKLAAARSVATAPAPIGHNNPPEPIEAEAMAAVVPQVEIIWDASGEAEDELAKPAPSPSRLKQAGAAMLGVIGIIRRYGANLGNVVLLAAAAKIGTGLGAYVISNAPDIQSLAERIVEFAKGLGNL